MQITPLLAGQDTGTAAADKSKIAGDFDRFLTLLTTQLQNQDPLSPLDANQFTSQLVQFSQVEQSVKMNSRLEELLAAQEDSRVANAIGYVGQTVDVLSPKVPLIDGGAEIFYAVDGEPATVSLRIVDETGRTVRTMAAPASSSLERVTWDGKDGDGNSVADGTYEVQVIARDAEEAALSAQVGFTGTVTEVSNKAAGLALTIGSIPIPVSEIVAVRRPATAS